MLIDHIGATDETRCIRVCHVKCVQGSQQTYMHLQCVYNAPSQPLGVRLPAAQQARLPAALCPLHPPNPAVGSANKRNDAPLVMACVERRRAACIALWVKTRKDGAPAWVITWLIDFFL